MNVVYIKHFENGKKYVGITNNFERRMYQHEHQEQKFKHYPIYRAMNKYNHYTEIVFESELYEDVLNMEKIIIKNFKDLGIELYNMTNGGEGILGYSHTDETKQKLRKINLGKNNPMYGKKVSYETILKLRKALSGENNPMWGKKRSKETREKISKSLSGENHPMYGKKHTEETKMKIRKNHVDNKGEKSPRANSKEHYQSTPTRRDKFKRTCIRMGWEFADFKEVFSDEYYYSPNNNRKIKKYYYIEVVDCVKCTKAK